MLLGIPDEEQEAMRSTSKRACTRTGQAKEYSGANMEGDYYGGYVDSRLRNPQEDLITKLLTEFDDPQGNHRTLTRSEALTYLGVIAGAGNHTTNRLITWTAKVLADNPDAPQVVEDRSLIPNVIEETLRFKPSSTQIARSVAHDVELYGQTVPAGSALLCLVGSANRDERQFEDPDR
jgi:cytochrome P450